MAAFICQEARRIAEMAQPGRRTANAIQGPLSEVFVEQKLGRMAPGGKADVLGRWERVLQRSRSVQRITVPYVSELFSIISEGEPILYKGVSYNPGVAERGESFSTLDFLSYVRSCGFRSVVLDASLYAVVNAMGAQPVMKYSRKSAEEAVSAMRSALAQFPEITESARVRFEYLGAASSALFPQERRPAVLDARSLWSDKLYLECLKEAMAFCSCQARYGGPLEVRRYAEYERYNMPFQRWYSVLVLAEALYLKDRFSVSVKLGPATESNFDSLIREFMRYQGVSYGFVWYDRSVEKKLPLREQLLFSDSEKYARAKLMNFDLSAWVKEIIAPFESQAAGFLGKVLSVMGAVNAEVSARRGPQG